MKVEPLKLNGAFYLEPKKHEDSRGFFMEWFNKKNFGDWTNVEFDIVQFNYSRSTKGVLRGLHYQLDPYAQSKLIAVIDGEVQDVIVDIRKGSKTFGEHYSVILSKEKNNQLFVPVGFAHGFLVLSDTAEIFYAVNNKYSPDHDTGINYSDPALNINWKYDKKKIIVSEKDKNLLNLNEGSNNFE